MPSARKVAVRSGGIVAHGYYDVIELAWEAVKALPPRRRAELDELVKRGPSDTKRAFWAAWWTDDRPTPKRWVEPDAIGIVEGEKAFGEAISAADSAIRRGKNARVYAYSLGGLFAGRAFKRGATRVSSGAAAFDEAGAAFIRAAASAAGKEAELVTVEEIRAAYRRRVAEEKLHPDQGGDELEFKRVTDAMRAAVAMVERNIKLDPAIIEEIRRRKKPKSRADVLQQQIIPIVADPIRARRDVLKIAREVGAQLRAAVRALAVERGYDHESLSGLCSIASCGLLSALREAKLIANIVGGACHSVGHFWIVIETETADREQEVWVDVTATQFRRDAQGVVVMPPGDTRRRRYEERVRGDGALQHMKPEHVELLRAAPKGWWRGVTAPAPKSRERQGAA